MDTSGAIKLAWRGLSYGIRDKKVPGGQRWILYPQDGEVGPGDLVALMGPSGSGKTSLLNALAGRLLVTRGASFTGDVAVNGVPQKELPCSFAELSAYVEQEDVLYTLSTVQETLDFAARLRLPSQTSAAERAQRIAAVLRQLGLINVQHTFVGGTNFLGSTRGLSGGERKRLSIAVELLHCPRVLLLDEPTTGLDSYQALNVMEKLGTLAGEGNTVVVSIHQPRSSIFAMLTSVYLLAAGRPAYAGPGDEAIVHFARLGHPLPPKFNPGDFLIDLVSVDQRNPEEREKTEQRRADLQAVWAAMARNPTSDGTSADASSRRQSILDAKPTKPPGNTSFFMPFLLLFRRTWREQMRDKALIGFKITFMGLLTTIFVLVYWQMGYTQANIQDRMGLIFFAVMNLAFTAVTGCAQIIPRQLVVVNRERANGMYPTFPFYVGSIMAMLPSEALPQTFYCVPLFFLTNLSGSFWVFVGVTLLETFIGISLGMAMAASFTHPELAAQVAPPAVSFFIIFAGFMINEASVPIYFTWLQHISFVRYAFKALVVNEFEHATFDCPESAGWNPACVRKGSAVLKKMHFDGEGVIKMCVLIMFGILLVFNILAYAILLFRRPRFLVLQPAAVASAAVAAGAAGATAASPAGPATPAVAE